MMFTLDEFSPTAGERAQLLALGLWHDQVAIGFLRAQRKANGGRPADTPQGSGGLGDLFNDMFTRKGPL